MGSKGITCAYTLVCLLMVGALPEAGEAQAQVPAGSYLGSCSNVELHGTTLRASCTDTYGRTRHSELREVDRCLGDIGNSNGTLTCKKSGNVPPGSYLQSCIDPSLSGNTLTARCETTYGRMDFASLRGVDRCRGDISNINGQLTCDGR